MGYYIRAGLVEENVDFLREIATRVASGDSVRIAATPATVSQKYWQIMRLLKGAEVLIGEANGAFRGLKAQVRVVKSFSPPEIRIEGKETLASLTIKRDSEHDALAALAVHQGRVMPLRFVPSPLFDSTTFAGEVEKRGFTLGRNTDTGLPVYVEDGDERTYIAYRRAERQPSPFDIFDK